jgi:hypothetical protein
MATDTARTQLKIKDGEVVCPQCGGVGLVHAYDISQRTSSFRISAGEIVAHGHTADECHTYRVVCCDCGWQETDCGIDVE